MIDFFADLHLPGSTGGSTTEDGGPAYRYGTQGLHELRAPLITLRNRLEHLIASMETKDLTNSRSEIDRSLRDLGHVKDLVDGTARHAAAATDSPRSSERTIDLAGITREAAGLFAAVADHRNVALLLDLPPDSIPVHFDEDRLRMVVSDLVDNALKQTSAGGQVRVEVALAELENVVQGRLRIYGKNHGSGAEVSRTEFSRHEAWSGESGAPPAQGTELGLSLVREFVRSQGGRTEILSRPGIATTVTVWLPLDRTHRTIPEFVDVERWVRSIDTASSGDGHSSAVELPVSSVAPLGRPHVLVIDESESLCRCFARELQPQFDVSWVRNAETGYDHARYGSPDVVICDSLMEGEDGLSLIGRIKMDRELRAIPILMLTTLAVDHFRVAAASAHADAVLVKPVDLRELRLLLAELVRGQAVSDEEVRSADENAHTDFDSDEEAFLSRARQVVSARMNDENFDIQQLADSLFVSRRVLERRMKDITGLSPNLYVRRLRLERAQSLIERRAVKTVAEVAQAVGFRDASYFSRLYRSKKGTSPFDLLHDHA